MRSTRQRAGVVIVKEFSQLFAQTFVALALVPKNDGAFEQGVLQLLGQVAPEIGRGRAEDQKVPLGGLAPRGSDASFTSSPSARVLAFANHVEFPRQGKRPRTAHVPRRN
jgi:hypothetical protein